MKLNLGSGGVKGFFVHHGEKVATLVIFGVAGVFFASGASVDKIASNMTPSALQKTVDQVEVHVSASSWALVLNDRVPTRDYTEILNNTEPTKEADFRPNGSWISGISVQLQPRKDPKLFKPNKPELAFANGAIAFKKDGTLTASALDLEDRTPFEEDKKKKPAKKKPMRSAELDSSGGYESADPSSTGEESSFSGPARGKYLTLSPIMRKKLVGLYPHLWQPNTRSNSGKINAVAQGSNIVAIKSVVPWQKQWNEYKTTFETAMAYLPSRDTPKYIWFEAFRIDVTDDPTREVTDADPGWKLIANSNSEFTRAEKWAGVVKEICNPEYLDDSLTMPIPPVALRDYTSLALPSDVPEYKPKVAESEVDKPDSGEVEPEDDPLSEGPMDFTKRRKSRSSSGAAGSGSEEYGTGDSDMMSSEADGYEGGVSSGRSSASSKFSEPTVSHKIVRFFDLQTQPGRSYRYKVRVWLADPNNSQKTTKTSGRDGNTALQDSMLADDVVDRVEAVRKADEDYLKRSRRERQTYWRITDSSEPSEVITIPKYFREVVSGPSQAARLVRITGENPGFYDATEPKGTLVPSAWDKDFAVDVPVKQEVQLGSVLNSIQNADVLHPITWDPHRLQSYNLRTDYMVLDIRGGDSLDTNDFKETLTVPGEFLIMDSKGNLIVGNEIGDMEKYRLRLFMQDESEGATSESEYSSEGSPESGGYGDGYSGDLFSPPE